MSISNRTANAVIVLTITTVLCVLAIVTLVPYDHMQRSKSNRRMRPPSSGPHLVNSRKRDHCNGANDPPRSKPNPVCDPDPVISESDNSASKKNEASFFSSDDGASVIEREPILFSLMPEAVTDVSSASSIDTIPNQYDHHSPVSVSATVPNDVIDIPPDPDNCCRQDSNETISETDADNPQVPVGDFEDPVDQQSSNHNSSQQEPEERDITASHPDINSSSKSGGFPRSSSVDIVTTFSTSTNLAGCTPDSVQLWPYEFRCQSPEEMLAFAVERIAERRVQQCKSGLKTFYHQAGKVPHLQDDLVKWESVQHLASLALQIRVSAYFVKVQELFFIDKFRKIYRAYERTKDHKHHYSDGVRDYFRWMIAYKTWKDDVEPEVRDYTERIQAKACSNYILLATECVEKQIEMTIRTGLTYGRYTIRHFQRFWHFCLLQKAYAILDFLPTPIQQALLKFEQCVSAIENCYFDRSIGFRSIRDGNIRSLSCMTSKDLHHQSIFPELPDQNAYHESYAETSRRTAFQLMSSIITISGISDEP